MKIQNTRMLALLEASLVTFLWSTSYVLIRIGLDEINPLAFDLLKNLDNKINILDLTIKVIYFKKENKTIKSNIITKEDFETILPIDLKETKILQSSIYKTPTESKFIILKDPTNMINPIEGLEGFKDLFNSRFNKLLKIALQRPDSYKIKKINSSSS